MGRGTRRGNVRENPNGTTLDLRFFDPTPGKRNVIESFLAKDLKKRAHACRDLLKHLAIMQHSSVATLRAEGKLEFVRGDILSYRFKVQGGGNLWVRLLCATWPSDDALVILHPLIKKRNDLKAGDIDHADSNLRALRTR